MLGRIDECDARWMLHERADRTYPIGEVTGGSTMGDGEAGGISTGCGTSTGDGSVTGGGPGTGSGEFGVEGSGFGVM